jgi:hypothetical protein
VLRQLEKRITKRVEEEHRPDVVFQILAREEEAMF